jgi:predicted nucleic acid-binding protein
VKVAFDTSVLVAGLVESHPRFGVAAVWLDQVDEGAIQGVWSSHAYAETWSVLTRLPLRGRLAPESAVEVLDSLVRIAAPIELTVADYQAAARRAAAAGGRSGIVFDALHLVAAERMGADALLTFNTGDFQRLSPETLISEPLSTVEALAQRLASRDVATHD